MTERIRKFKEYVTNAKFPLCIDRMAICIDVLETMKDKTQIQRRAAIQAAILDRIPIDIEDGDTICGIAASKPNGIEMDYDTGPWSKDEIEAIKAEGMYVISPEDEERLYGLVDRYNQGDLGSTTSKLIGEVMGDDKFWPFMKSGVTPPAWKSKTAGSGGGRAQSGLGVNAGAYLVIPEYPRIINEGARAIIDECKKQLAGHEYFGPDCVDKRQFWLGCIDVYEAWIRLAHRYADLAEKKAAEETDAVRAQELRDMAERCRRVPEYPARDFREAVQAFWFTFLLTNPQPSTSAGRFDQYMYPLFKKDKEEGRITDEEALELLELLRLKDFQLNRINGKVSREKNAGMAKWHNWTLGGVDKDGNCAVNDITYLEFRAAYETQTPHHTISLRVNENTPIKTIVEGLKVVRTGLGMPCFVGDKSYINFFMSKGLSLETARDYCLAGCVDGVIPYITRVSFAPMMVVTLVYDIFMHNGWCPFIKEMVGIQTGDVREMKTFEEYKEAFFKQLDYIFSLAAQKWTVEALARQKLMPEFFISALLRGGIKDGMDLSRRHIEPYDSLCVVSAVGMINIADSMAAVKSLVYDQKKYTMDEMMKAIDANWVGYEEMQKDCLAVAKYGNNDDLPDLIARDLYEGYANIISKYDTVTGGKYVPNAISITSHQPGGKCVGALPSGRKAGEILADGSTSPDQGKDTHGPLAAFQSAMKIKQDQYQAMLMNMKFLPSALKTDEDLEKLAAVIKTYLTNGGKHIQFNVVDANTLYEAKAEPEKHKDLIVRVAGYSAYFTLLTPMIQNEVINRTAHENI